MTQFLNADGVLFYFDFNSGFLNADGLLFYFDFNCTLLLCLFHEIEISVFVRVAPVFNVIFETIMKLKFFHSDT